MHQIRCFLSCIAEHQGSQDTIQMVMCKQDLCAVNITIAITGTMCLDACLCVNIVN